MTEFEDWLDQQSAVHRAEPPEKVWLRRAAWEELWARRPKLPELDLAVELASSLVNAMTTSARFDEELLHTLGATSARGISITIKVRPQPTLMCCATSRGHRVTATIDEGHLRFTYALLSLELYDLAATGSAARDPQPLLTGPRDSQPEPLERVLDAYLGTIRATGANYIPLVVRHSDKSRPLALWALAGYLAFAAFHELAHQLLAFAADEGSVFKEKPTAHHAEIMCDSIAAELLLASTRSDERLRDGGWFYPLRGGLMVPTLAAVTEQVAFLIAPVTHPSQSAREQMIARTFADKDFFSRVVDSPVGGEAQSVVREYWAKTREANEPRSQSWPLMQCLDPQGPIAFLICEVDGVTRPPDAESGHAPLIGLAMMEGEEYFARLFEQVYLPVLEVGRRLTGEDLRTAVPHHILWAFDQKVRELLPRLEPSSVEIAPELQVRDAIYVAVGQGYFTEVFLRVFRPVLDSPHADRYGITYQDVKRAMLSSDDGVVLHCCDWIQRVRFGDEHPAILPPNLARQLLVSVLIARTSRGELSGIDSLGRAANLPPEVIIERHRRELARDAEALRVLGYQPGVLPPLWESGDPDPMEDHPGRR